MATHISQVANLATFTIDELAEFYSAPQTQWVRSNMAISLDGHFSDVNGSSRGLSSSLDVTILLLLRALSDVVLVGGSTARQENYVPKLPRAELAHLSATPPRLCVVTESVTFSPVDSMFQQDVSAPIIVTGKTENREKNERIEALRDVAEVIELEEVKGAAIVSALALRGLTSVVSEGGPFVQNLLRSDDVINELDVTIAPAIMGTPHSGPAFGFGDDSLELTALARGGSHIYARYTLSR